MNLNDLDYADAVVTLLKLAMLRCGSSRVAAQVLLSAYDGNGYQLDVTDLCNLDSSNYAAAMAVIHGRRLYMTEPHRLVENGDAIFRKLHQDWKRLHVKNRHKVSCDDCRGVGFHEDEGSCKTECKNCDGLGLVSELV